jgi:hypothetical protein
MKKRFIWDPYPALPSDSIARLPEHLTLIPGRPFGEFAR